MKLKSVEFKDDARLELAASNSPPMRQGERGRAVEKLQLALFAYGHLPFGATFRKGHPDGIYGNETKNAVISFQRSISAKQDGVAGHVTIVRLDELLALDDIATIIPGPPGVGPFGPFVPDAGSTQARRMQARMLRSRVA